MTYFSGLAKPKAWEGTRPSLPALASSLRGSWDALTAYAGNFDRANPAAGQCYPTSRVVEWFYPDYPVVRGEVITQLGIEHHFWNVRGGSQGTDTIDLSWEQFPPASTISWFDYLLSDASADSPGTQHRCHLLLMRVLYYLERG